MADPTYPAIKAHLDSTANPHGTTAAQVGADPAGTASASMAAHLADADPHTGYTTDAELSAGLAGKANTSHTHTASEITDSTTAGRALLTAADAAAQRTALQILTRGTAVAATSGTSIDFTSLPAAIKRLTVMLQGVSTSGTSTPQIRLGTSGGIVSSGYTGSSNSVGGSTAYSAGFDLNRAGVATDTLRGHLSITRISGNDWVASGVVITSASDRVVTAGSVTLSGELTQLRLTTVNGTDAFDAGSVNIMWEL